MDSFRNTKQQENEIWTKCHVCEKPREGVRANQRGPLVNQLRSFAINVSRDAERRYHETPQGKEPTQSPSLFGFQLHLTKHFPGLCLIEKSHDDSGILALQNGERNRAPEGGLDMPERPS